MGLLAEMWLLVVEEGLFEIVYLIVTGIMMTRWSEVERVVEETFVLFSMGSWMVMAMEAEAESSLVKLLEVLVGVEVELVKARKLES